MKRLEVRVPEGEAARRADRALARLLPEIPGWQVRAAFERRDVKRNGKRIAKETVVQPGDTLTAYVPDAPPLLDIVLDEAEYLIVNKRQGMQVQGAGSVEEVYQRMTGQPVYACHRLDVLTGGLVLLAKDEDALMRARHGFEAHALEKTYEAIVRGMPDPPEATLHAYLRKNAEAAKVRVTEDPAPGAMPIETRYRTLSTEDGLSRLSIQLVTGRTHQIRAHLAHIGHPILGDDKYGDRALNRAHGVRAQKLWAVRLVLWDGRAFEVGTPF